MKRYVSSVRDHCSTWFARLKSAAAASAARLQPLAAALCVTLKPLVAAAWQRLRHPTRRGVLIAMAALPALFVLYVLVLIPFTPGIGDIRKARVDRPAQILSADGKLLAEFKPSNREWVPLAQISPHMIDALIATEDHRFYEHHGIDWRRTAGAALHTFSGDRQGGSTITQQLARNLYPDEVGRAPTLTRKLKEAITALKIEAVYSKPQILETYLNTVPFLYNAYGIEMASRTYFDRSADQLDILQAATLTGMLKGNSYYNPVINPERALQRRNTVLAQMVKYGKLSEADYARLKGKPLRVDFERQTEPPGPAPHFAQQLRKWLIAWADRNDYNIYSDGLIVRTTIDSRLQSMATAALTQHGNQLQSIANGAWSGRSGCSAGNDLFRTFIRETPDYRAARDAGQPDADAIAHLASDHGFMRALCKSKTDVQAGFLAIDPRNGQIKAWVGSRDFANEPFDHVQQARRQPGSTFKPFVYGAAFAQGAKPADTFIDQPVEIPLAGGEVWQPTDDVSPSGKPVTLRDALAYSRNRITAQLMMQVGPDRVARLARAMGVRDSRLDAVPSLALGTSPVTLKEMVSAYGTIANDGSYLEPRMITRIEDSSGDVLAEFAPASPERALPVAADRTLLDTMRDVVNRGTGSSIRSRFGIRADVAGKTGTTQDNTDGWFILMSPQLVAGAWVGFDDGRVTLGSDYWGQGARSALPIVGDFFQRALRSRLVDPRARFTTDVEPGAFEMFREKLRAWIDVLFASHEHKPQTPAAPVRRAPPARPAPAPVPAPVPSAPSAASAPETPAFEAAPPARPLGVPPIIGPASAPQGESPFPSQEPALAPTPTPDAPEPMPATGDDGAQQGAAPMQDH
ncbi:penicillin-binding protein 1A [Paraburkholderia caballeronis]|uniref:Penicillin-binding protein 1A n=1 Tax=Paraburkholderia caballeronis TaxID=416943 RepID=A0A1H7VJT5_9BURK|nr:transglycosylase domain-containing protein [Paraburkholderia caballeronis]PXW16022.1 penicillin-binding protein 1A [Paraburkholderia caballeronis]PXW93924.1 penicillin-binding protein 1A [Paraburkholderia caballeronis]RAJ89053.1 penicillin-binding protein 1A [Paraburkholderia caballeronis]SED89573.1 penicillin-binding protein 1A [Paraburkholderia caballeronis]SEM09115.1 penicillin-binding protein 1A [Paraburkholderia caballeronis]